jgi:hypothetical protein
MVISDIDVLSWEIDQENLDTLRITDIKIVLDCSDVKTFLICGKGNLLREKLSPYANF